MCKCIRYWERDLRERSPHNMVPVTCEEYISGLKVLLTAWVESTQDKKSELVRVSLETLKADHVPKR